MHNLELADSNISNELKVDILIGANYIWDFMSEKIRRGESGPVAVQTTLGWVSNGKVDQNKCNLHVLKISCEPFTLNDIDNSFDKFWLIESTGVLPEKKVEPNLIETICEKITFMGSGIKYHCRGKRTMKSYPISILIVKIG